MGVRGLLTCAVVPEAPCVHADEWLIDIANVEVAPLTSSEVVGALCDEVIAAFRLTLVAAPMVHRFPGAAGITALYLLSESHLAIHTWPERRGALLSLGTCRPGVPESFSWSDVVCRHLGAHADVVVRRVERSIA